MHLGKRPFEVLDQIGEAPLYRALPGDQNIIIAFHGAVGRRQSHRFLQASPRSIALNRSTQGLGRGEAEPGEVVLLGFPVPFARLEHERRRNVPGAAPYMQKLRAGLETSDRRHRSVCRLTPTDACVPWLCAARAPSDRPPSPCVRESRGASCGRAAMVDRCVSRERLLARSCRSQRLSERRFQRGNSGAYRVRERPKSIRARPFRAGAAAISVARPGQELCAAAKTG